MAWKKDTLRSWKSQGSSFESGKIKIIKKKLAEHCNYKTTG